MGINIIRDSNKFVKFFVYIVFIVSITNSALSQNLKEIQNRMKGWQLESFRESYDNKVKKGVSLFKKNLSK